MPVMPKTHRETVMLNTAMCDLNSAWRPSSMMTVLQETAAAHCQELGVGRLHLLDEQIVWIITRLEAQMDRWPALGETVTVETFNSPTRRWIMPRWFRVFDGEGKEIGRAGSLWCLMDLPTRRMAAPDRVAARMPDNSDLPLPMGMPGTPPLLDAEPRTESFRPQYTDLDANGHVNNTRYVDWCCNALGIDLLKEKQLSRFTVNYAMEVRPGQEVRTELRLQDGRFSYKGEVDGVLHFDMGGELRDR